MLRYALLGIFSLVLVVGFLLWPAKSTEKKRRPFWGRCFAHRGLHTQDKQVPENSLAAFSAAVAEGYGIELDVQLTSDGVVVVFHDDDLTRMCGVKKRVDAMTWEELHAMELLDTGEKIPVLAEVLAVVQGQVPLLVELKTGKNNPELCRKTCDLLTAYEGRWCIQSFDPRIVGWFRKNAKGVLRGQLAARPKLLGGGLVGLAVGNLLCNIIGRPHFVSYEISGRTYLAQLVRDSSMRMGWTVRNEEEMERAQQENDAVIFEFCSPAPKYKSLPKSK